MALFLPQSTKTQNRSNHTSGSMQSQRGACGILRAQGLGWLQLGQGTPCQGFCVCCHWSCDALGRNLKNFILSLQSGLCQVKSLFGRSDLKYQHPLRCVILCPFPCTIFLHGIYYQLALYYAFTCSFVYISCSQSVVHGARKLTRNAHSWAPSQSQEIRISGCGIQQAVF